MWEKLLNLDTHLLLWFNSHHSPFWDSVMWFISGKMEWVPMYLILIGFIIYKYRKDSIWIFIAVIILITLSDSFAARVIKDSVQRFRPTHNPAIANMVHIVNNYRGGDYGFVSNHASNSFALAVFLSLLFRNRYFTIGILIWAAIVSYSRIYLGVHYPGDILGGALLGVGWAYGIYWCLQRFLQWRNMKKQVQQTENYEVKE